MSVFTPLSGLAGGSLIGLSAATLLLGNGDTLAISCLLGSTVRNPKKLLNDPKEKWKLSFLASFLIIVQVYINFFERDIDHFPTIKNGANLEVISPLGYWISGLLVGFGTRVNICVSSKSKFSCNISTVIFQTSCRFFLFANLCDFFLNSEN